MLARAAAPRRGALHARLSGCWRRPWWTAAPICRGQAGRLCLLLVCTLCCGAGTGGTASSGHGADGANAANAASTTNANTTANADATAGLVDLIASVKPSIVGIGSYQKSRTPALRFIGTGFVVGDGLTVLTAAHVIQSIQNAAAKSTLGDKESIGVLIDLGGSTQFRGASVARLDPEHDLARLRIGGDALPALALGDSTLVKEGQAMAFTGFPLGMVLGLHHVTHRAMVSSITPVIMPAASAARSGAKPPLGPDQPAYAVFQLDASAYPGSSGSPLYDASTGAVYGVVNMVYIQSRKASASNSPSGITYAIPSNFVRAVMLEPLP